VKAKEMRSRSAEELQRIERDTVEQIFRSRIKNATHQLDKSSEIGKARRELARIKTVLRERQLGLNAGASGAAGEEE
jgi:large subunit ribosomal protein L29